jgi:UDPglucose--hexose-1-phosphate uridylyltransferase
MPEIRKNYLTNDKVIIAKIRSERPKSDLIKTEDEDITKCPFCKETDTKLTPAKLVYYKDENGDLSKTQETEENYIENWIIKAIPNLYPAFDVEDIPPKFNDIYIKSEKAYGIHEVVLDTPEHNNYFHLKNSEMIINLFNFYKDRFIELSKEEGVEYISISKNHGSKSGGTILHPHSQIIASQFIPNSILEELSKLESEDTCLYESIIESEKKSLRYVCENNDAIAICPFASTVPYEVWVFPKKHVNSIGQLECAELECIGLTVRDVVRAISQIFENVSYNIVFNQTIKQEKYHMYVKILPRFYYQTGFELNYQMPINEIPPEEAAQEMRKFFGG